MSNVFVRTYFDIQKVKDISDDKDMQFLTNNKCSYFISYFANHHLIFFSWIKHEKQTIV